MIKGEKVILRPMTKDDIERQHEFNQDLDLFLVNASLPHVSPLERAQEMYELCTKKDRNAQYFAIEADGKYIGNCSLKLSSAFPGIYRLGILIGDRDYLEKGYGTDTVRLLLQYGFHYLGARRISLGTNAKNLRAIKCFRACGFVEEGRSRKVQWIDGDYTDLVTMGILREEWEATERNRQNSVELR